MSLYPKAKQFHLGDSWIGVDTASQWKSAWGAWKLSGAFFPGIPGLDEAHLRNWKWDKDVVIKNATRRAFPRARFTDFCSQDDKTVRR